MDTKRTIELLKFLEECGKKTWGEIEQETSGGHRKHHGQPLDSLCAEARERLRAQGLTEDSEEELFRFRLTGPGRLWGFKSGSLFKLIWWDENHQVYPLEKRNS
ncbi:hypothetical protein [Nesterenkonia lutea]